MISATPRPSVVAVQFELKGRHPEAPRFYERGEGSRAECNNEFARDPSLRLKSGSARDDALRKNQTTTTVVPRPTLCDTYAMQSPLQSPTAATDPKSVKVNLTTGTGVDIDWADGHESHYNFVYLRDACPCAMCEDERAKSGRRPGEPAVTPPGTLVMFKPTAKPVSAEGVGKYAIKFSWNDNHDLGIYSWKFLREVCPCAECKALRVG